MTGSLYFNTASLGLPSTDVIARMHAHMRVIEAKGPLAAAEIAQEELSALPQSAARLLGGDRDGIGRTTTTSATLIQMLGWCDLAGKRVLVTPHEWHSTLYYLALHKGAKVEPLPMLDLDAPDLSAWQDRIGEDVAVISAPMVSSITGRAYPIAEIGALKRPEGCLFLVDGAQALGQVPLDMAQLGCDGFVATRRKWLGGPRGTALFWMSQAKRRRVPVDVLEPFDLNDLSWIGALAAMNAALDEGVEQRRAAIRQRADVLYNGAATYGYSGPAPMTGAVTLHVPQARVEPLKAAFTARGITVKWPNPATDEPLSPRAPKGHVMLRLSPGLTATGQDLDACLACLKAAADGS
ncbi:selenocysteine lyase/cysteine desulfurase [Rubricella aquisinus]|uniref:Selenocysteine lyase/cysteine desulfurase n=1 Tax=Rubricella aquisinus TaxID=2028108 RepID=A0A840WL16_9RHOB|nr:aminotransferase class V-fold PLP-dependent enzyme [Rubricella aquisinus]MBB5514352.1 selenocysteine lyase/cysteine desulfurase [Rubricella aquisinus]